MDDRTKALHRLTQLCRETPEATPYVLGYLAYRNETPVLEQAIDSWFEHDAQLEVLVAAERQAAKGPFESPEVPLKSGVETLPS